MPLFRLPLASSRIDEKWTPLVSCWLLWRVPTELSLVSSLAFEKCTVKGWSLEILRSGIEVDTGVETSRRESVSNTLCLSIFFKTMRNAWAIVSRWVSSLPCAFQLFQIHCGIHRGYTVRTPRPRRDRGCAMHAEWPRGVCVLDWSCVCGAAFVHVREVLPDIPETKHPRTEETHPKVMWSYIISDCLAHSSYLAW